MAQVPDSSSSDSTLTEIVCPIDPSPELVGSVDSLNAVVRYTPEALEAGIEGRVFVQVLVEPGGAVSEAEVLRGLGYGLDEEVERVARDLEWRWPDDARRIRMTLPVTFRLPKRE